MIGPFHVLCVLLIGNNDLPLMGVVCSGDGDCVRALQVEGEMAKGQQEWRWMFVSKVSENDKDLVYTSEEVHTLLEHHS